MHTWFCVSIDRFKFNAIIKLYSAASDEFPDFHIFRNSSAKLVKKIHY